MKNFYEATVTRPKLKLNFNLILNPVGEDFPCTVSINKQIAFAETISSVQTITGEIALLDPLDIQIKIKREHPQAIDVTLVVDGYEVIPKYQHHAVPPTNYIDFNEEWTISIPNFYQWYHTITGQGDIF